MLNEFSWHYVSACATSATPGLTRKLSEHPNSVRPCDVPQSQRNAGSHSSRPNGSASSFWYSLALVGVGVSAGVVSVNRFREKNSALASAHCLQSPASYNFIADAVEKAAPSVVSIQASYSILGGRMSGKATGSGFVVDNGNFVVTNAHVVSNVSSVEIQLSNGKTVKGKVTYIDEVTDLALIRMYLPRGITVPALKFGNAEDIRPGEWVVAMGSPLTLTNTITCGIVSSVHRLGKDLGLRNNDMEYIQTDAAITVGNSGGPLVNLNGEVVGVNTITAGPGISFAIPCSVAQNFVENASKTTEDRDPDKVYTIGVTMLSLSPQMMPTIQQYFSAVPKEITGGVLLARVWPQSPAYHAGLKRGDLVVRVNGQHINSTKDMYKMVQSGEKLYVEFYRKLQYMTCTITPEPMQ